MLQNIQGSESKTKILKINEEQYNRIFKGNLNSTDKISKGIKKNALNEETKKVDLLTFAQELIVFIKDMLSRPETAPFSKFWLEQGISKDKLMDMLDKEGLLTASLDETEGITKYVSEKFGFRKKVKECYKKINELGGYPAGAEHDSRAPFNEPDSEPEPEKELGIKAEKEILKLIYYNEDLDGLCIFKNKNNVTFAITLESLVTFKGEKLEPYLDSDQTLETANANTAKNYINDKLYNQQIKAFSSNAPDGELALINQKVKNKLIKFYGEDKTLVSILNNIDETTGAASSGAFVGGGSFNGPIKKDTGMSPEEALQDISEEEGIDKTYTHFAIYKPSGKIATGWEYNGVDNEDIKYFSKIDLVDNFPEIKVDNFKILRGKSLESKGIKPLDSSNWGNPHEHIKANDMSYDVEESRIEEVIDPQGVVEYHSDRDGEGKFDIDGITWEYCNVIKDGKVELGVFRYGQDIAYSYDWFNKSILKNDIEETTSTGSVGGESGTFAYDANALGTNDFMTAGNKLNKGKGDMPIIKRQIGEGVKLGQVYKNGAGRRKINSVNKLTGVIKARQWGDSDAKDLNLTRKDFGGWELVHENKKLVLKITETQLKRILENDNQTSTAYPNGEMVDFDDCTKLNNNKVAQNGGCNQGDDGVVKYNKTKDSVVAEVSRITGKSIKEVKSIIESNETQRLIPLFVSAINQVDESLGYEELAKAIGYIVNEHYGTHLADRFMSALNQIIVRNN